MVHLLDPSTTIHSLLSKWDEFLSPPFRVTIDCSLILIDSNGDFRYNWAQVIISHLNMFPRNLLLNYFLKCHFDDNIFQPSLHINTKQRINSFVDFDELLAEMKDIKHYDLLEIVGQKHQAQSCFDRSDFRPFVPITCSFYIQKFF